MKYRLVKMVKTATQLKDIKELETCDRFGKKEELANEVPKYVTTLQRWLKNQQWIVMEGPVSELKEASMVGAFSERELVSVIENVVVEEKMYCKYREYMS